MSKSEKLKLLLVEDNKAEIDAYKKSIEIFGQKNNLEVDVKVEKRLEEALKAISYHFDAAIVDIRLEDDKPGAELGGETLVNRLLKEFRIPTFVYTGTPGIIDQIEDKENILFKKYVKAEVGIKDILKEIKFIFDSGITRIIGRRGLIEEMLDKIFWEHIADNLDLKDLTPDSEKKILRYIAAHLQEYLELGESGQLEVYTPDEVYIHPPIKKGIYTGNILREKDSGDYFIVLTPACDLAQQKAKSIVITSIENLKKDGIVKQNVNIIKKRKTSDDDKRAAEEVLKRIIGNNFSNKYYFLPLSNFFEGGLINFQKLISGIPKELEEKYDLIASVTAPFLKDIIARFSIYYSRQGAPDLNKERIIDILTSESV
jgi:CheY-like chemotaxis protein